MPTSEARILANRQNALKSSGPKTAEGKAASRRNGLKHGLTGRGVVLAEGDAAEVARRNDDLLREMAPRSTMGVALVLQMATLSVRMERGAKQEIAAIASRVRHAADDFDEARIERAEALLGAIGEDPRKALRQLRRMPEGVELLLEAWRDLRGDLTREGKPTWVAAHMVKAANLLGIKEEDARRSRVGVLSRGHWGDFAALADHEGGGLDEAAREAWSRARLVERIDEVILELEEHYEDLDHELIALDRAEAGGRALFDPSKEAALARRYESEARRGFFKALKEFRQVESEVEAAGRPAAPAASRPEPSPPAPEVAPLGSSWEAPDPLPGESFAEYRERALRLDEAAQKAEVRPSTTGRAAPTRN